MAEYELVREIQNNCSRNQMRDVFFEEVNVKSPEEYVRNLVKGRDVELTVEPDEGGGATIFVTSGGVEQKFIFTPI
ncbi:MAG: hypothetical protein R3Y62_03740 [Eubacteriales bacterium]